MKKILARAAAVLGPGGLLVAYLAAPAAASVDPAVSTAVTGGFSDATDLLTTLLIPALFTLAIIGIAAGVGLKYIRRAVKS